MKIEIRNKGKFNDLQFCQFCKQKDDRGTLTIICEKPSAIAELESPEFKGVDPENIPGMIKKILLYEIKKQFGKEGFKVEVRLIK